MKIVLVVMLVLVLGLYLSKRPRTRTKVFVKRGVALPLVNRTINQLKEFLNLPADQWRVRLRT